MRITGLSLTYQSTDPIDISAGSAGAITTISRRGFGLCHLPAARMQSRSH